MRVDRGRGLTIGGVFVVEVEENGRGGREDHVGGDVEREAVLSETCGRCLIDKDPLT